MCTVSWLVDSDGYQLFFNRDEQRSRSRALAPQALQQKHCKVLMPIDPDGGGSWISVNDQGLSLCLLNFYQGKRPTGVLKSRGQLLKSLSALPTQPDITTELSNTNLHQYAPFTLLTFTLDQHPQGLQWDGSTLTILCIKSPMTSSSVAFDAVYSARQRNFAHLGLTPDANQLLTFHSSHQSVDQPDKHSLSDNYQREESGQTIQGELSVCMHRDDAQTVSFSHIEVTLEKAIFTYLDGSPCAHQLTSIDALRDTANQRSLYQVQKGFHPVSSNQQEAEILS